MPTISETQHSPKAPISHISLTDSILIFIRSMVLNLTLTSYGFLQKPLVPASLDEVTMEHIGSELGK